MTGPSGRRPRRDPRLRRLVVGQGLAAVVEALFLVWLTLFVLDLAEPGIATGFVLLAASLPRAVLLLPAGVLVDRLGPAVVAVGAAWFRVAVLLGLGALVAFTAPTVTLLAGLLGVADAAYFPAALALLPTVVPTARLPRVNALVQGAESGGDLIGPAVAAGVIAAIGFVATLGGIVVTAVFAAVALSTLTPTFRRRTGRDDGDGDGRAALLDDVGPGAAVGEQHEQVGSIRALGEGLRYAWREPLVRAMLATTAVINLAVVGTAARGSSRRNSPITPLTAQPATRCHQAAR